MFRITPRICELCCRASSILSVSNNLSPRVLPVLRSSGLRPTPPGMVASQCRSVSVSRPRCNDEKGSDPDDLSQDPQIKEWMTEMCRDFEREGAQSKSDSKEGNDSEGEEARGIKPAVEESDIHRESAAKMEAAEAWTQFKSHRFEKFDTPQIIYDYDEERLRREEGLMNEMYKQEEMKEKVKLTRGEKGVFDVEELVDLLREENARDLVVIQVPASMCYVEYMVIVSGRSTRHLDAITQLVRRAYLAKKNRKDPPLMLEGRGTDWMALDMRNIVLHAMLPDTRVTYDLETLWTVGAEFDEKCQKYEDDLLGTFSLSDPLAGLGAPVSSSPPPSLG